MASVVRWDPFTLRTTVDRLEGFARPWRFLPGEYEGSMGFPVEVSETENEIAVKASMPGTKPEDVEISVINDVLTIKAEHKAEVKDEKRQFYRREIRYGSWHRSMTLPVSVDADKAEASFENGMLHLRLPKAEALRPKQIKVTANAGNGVTADHEAVSNN